MASASFGVIGNLARVTTTRPGRPPSTFLGGAAAHVVRSLVQSGARAAPISVVGTDLGTALTRPAALWSDRGWIRVEPGRSCSFRIHYDDHAELVGIDSDYGVAVALTEHALRAAGHFDRYHVCCRRPLDVARTLHGLRGEHVTVDFFASSVDELARAAEPYLRGVHGIFVNAGELTALERVVDVSRLELVVVSNGARTARTLRRGRVTATARPSRHRPGDTTGAGDTLAGTFLADAAAGADDASALSRAVSAASASVGEPRHEIGAVERHRRCTT